jgi:4-carboxymuconolactone decarboxylase
VTDKNQRARAEQAFEDVYGGVVTLPKGAADNDLFFRQLLDHLFGEVWARDTLSVRDRRLIALGSIAALGEYGAFEIHVRSALLKGEMTIAEAHEILAFVVCYTGYGRGLGLKAALDRAITAHQNPSRESAT